MHLSSAPKMATGGMILPWYGHWTTEEDDCHRLINRTTELPATAYVSVVCVPFLVLFCTAGNIANFWILWRHCQPGAKQTFLLSLAVVDVLALWCAVPLYLNNNSEIFGIDYLEAPFLVYSYGFFFWLQYTLWNVSDWILVAFSLDRLNAFQFRAPSRVHEGHRRRALFMVCGFFLLAGTIGSGTLVGFYHWWNNRTKYYVQPEWVAKWTRIRQQIDIACPIMVTVFLFVINLWLFLHLRKQMKLGRKLMSATNSITAPSGNARSQRAAKQRRQNHLTRMLLGCVAVYFITQLPAVILNTLDHLSFAPYCLFHFTAKPVWEPIISTLALVNYSSNFAVYVGMSDVFRQAAEVLASRISRGRCWRSVEDGPADGLNEEVEGNEEDGSLIADSNTSRRRMSLRQSYGQDDAEEFS
ncbi:hypothetical protein BV898_15576 [Hypsibius exemplaris]|uniref:G-protein coupled receptors family 1 profile domain-containing protein n=1 Tax=Hypsibius exemplaris TaxID=2072580 RepID=A0A9X6NE70_HYPEX|nr:hypothetical protein BV898_15576 [Hypsibius exemplaris]